MLEIWLAFSAGLAGSGHCLGMCGGIVTALALSRREADASGRFLFNLLYHAGRIVTYSMLGLLAGLVAAGGMTAAVKPFATGLFLAANLFVMAIGIGTAFGMRQFGISTLDGSWRGFPGRQLTRLVAGTSVFAAVPTGLLMGLLPCGLVYGVLISAATSGSPLKGAGMMLAFGCGTVPVILAYGQMASLVSVLGRGVLQRFMGGAVALLGMLGAWKALLTLGLHI